MTAEPARAAVVVVGSDDPAAAMHLARLQRQCNPSPWSEELWVESLIDAHTTVYVMPDAALGAWVGYLAVRAVAGEGEVLDTGVLQAARRAGVGSRLLTEAIDRLSSGGANALFLEVRVSNGPAQALYASLGFEQCGIRKGYYRAPVEDATVMRLDLGRTS